MKELTTAELYEDYIDTIQLCVSEIVHRSDEEIEYDLFEEFDVGAHSVLHDINLTRLWKAGYVDDEMVRISQKIRRRWLELQKSDWTVAEIRSRPEWQELFALCDQLVLTLAQNPPAQ
jgi:hypothetical protein